MTKTETLGKALLKEIEDSFCKYEDDPKDFWEYEAKRIYSKYYDLITYALRLEKQVETTTKSN